MSGDALVAARRAGRQHPRTTSKRKDGPGAGVRESRKVYRRDPSVVDGPLSVAGIAQPLHVAAIAWGGATAEQWGVVQRPVDFFDVKVDVEALFAPLGAAATPTFHAAAHPAMHPGRSARIESRGRAVGFIGELHPRWTRQYELPSSPLVFELVADALTETTPPVPEPVSRFPTVVRDLALVVDASRCPPARVLDAIAAIEGTQREIVRDVRPVRSISRQRLE